MPITRQKKEEVVAKTEEAVKNADSVVFVNFHGLNVADTTKLRGDLKEQGVGYMVAKKTLIRRALDAAGVEGEMPEIKGELALAYGLPAAQDTAQAGKDLITPAREVYSFQKQHEGALSIIGGIFDGAYMNQAQMTEIAAIPPTPVLYGQFVNLINSPVQQFAIALNQIAAKADK